MTNPDTIDFTNQFLIAMPGIADPAYFGAVVYLCEHTQQGALGLLINRPTEIDLQALFTRLELKLDNKELMGRSVYFGGPVQTERGFVLHEDMEQEYISSLDISGGLKMTTSRDVLEAVAQGEGPARFFIALGHAGWGAGQLENEITSNSWLTVTADPEIIFKVPPAERFDAALSLLGIQYSMLSFESGHA